MDSTASSFVMVEHGTASVPEGQLETLARYFPSLAQPSAFVFSDPALVDRVRTQRSHAPDGRLYVDELLSLVGLDGPNEYPPASPNALQAVIAKVLSSKALSSLNLSSILYYLALACSPATATAFAQSRLLPPEFSLSIQAFHALDTGDYPLAIRLLTDPRIRQPDFAPKTFRLLAVAPGAEPEHRHSFVLSYWRLSGLELTHAQGQIGVAEAELVVRALCDPRRKRGAAEAWDLARHWGPENEVERLMRAVLAASFGDNRTRLPTGQHLQALLAFPFTPAELSLLTSFSLSPPTTLPSTSRSLVVDWLLSLLISSAKPLEALVLFHKLQSNGSLEPSEERERLVKALEGTLTTSQKTTLSIEIAALSASTIAPADTGSLTRPETSSKVSSTLTQPAWVTPVASTPTVAPSTPARTLAAARQSKLPPAVAPAPKPVDLPLSASPFVRKDGGAGQGVLKALREQQHAGLQHKGVGALLGSPAKAATGPGSPRRGTGLSSRGFGGPPRGGSAIDSVNAFESSIGSTRDDTNGHVGGTPLRAKPTLAGFGSVRQPQPQLETRSMSIEVPFTPSMVKGGDEGDRDDVAMAEDVAVDDDDDDENREIERDQVMLIPSPQNETLPIDSPAQSLQARDDAFSRRIALDPAIQKTLLAASTSSPRKPIEASSSSLKKKKDHKTPKRARAMGGTGQELDEHAASSTTNRDEPDRGDQKRRAVPGGGGRGKDDDDDSSSSHINKNEDETGAQRLPRDKPDQSKTVKLPPGAFPGFAEEDLAATEGPSVATRRAASSSRAGSAQPEMTQVGGTTRPSTTAKPRTTTSAAGGRPTQASRRSQRARSTSVAPPADDDDDHDDDRDSDDRDRDGEQQQRGAPARRESEPTNRRRRSSRATSLQPPASEMTEVSKTPVRRSSRLSGTTTTTNKQTTTNSTTTNSTTRGGTASRRSTRRGHQAIEEEQGDEDTGGEE